MFLLKRTFTVAIFAAFALLACTPEDGATGPVGPIGPEGQIGPAGPQGEQGADGNANVQDYVFLVSGGTWTNSGNKIVIPELTREIAKNGAVLIYESDSLNSDSTNWRETPYRFVGNVGGAATFITIATSYVTGEIAITAKTSSNQNVTFPVGFDMNFKVVLIESSNKIDGLDYTNYEEVKMVYGLEE